MRRTLALLATLALACTPSPADDTGLEAVATVYPLAWLVTEVAPEAELLSLAAGGQDPHDLELTPGERGRLERADVVATLGPIGFQPQVEAALGDVGGQVVSAADVAGEERLRHVDAHSHEGEGDAGTEEASEVVDPHLWFDAALMADLATAVGEAFAQAYPGGAVQYRQRAAEVAAGLSDVADDIAGLLRDCTHDEIIVSHEAYAYLLAPHDLEQHGISGAAGHSEASPADIAELAAEISAEQIPAVLSEPVEGRDDAEAVAREAGVEVIDIYSLDIVDDEQAAQGFPALLREQAEAVAQAAECAGAP